MTISNPYVAGPPVHPNEFIGRHREVERIFALVRNHQSVSIEGERRIGKTSLLRYVCDEEVHRKFLPDFENYIFVFRDLQALGRDLNDSTFYQYLAEGITGESQISENIHNFLALNRLITQTTQSRRKYIVFVLDELDILASSSNISSALFAGLRSLTFRSEVSYITSSFHSLIELESDRGSYSPFYNIFSTLYLGPFTRDEAIELICGPSSRQGLTLEPYSDFLLDIAGYHPYLLQLACLIAFDRLAKSKSRQLSKTDYVAIKANLAESAELMFRYILERAERSWLYTFDAIVTGRYEQGDSKVIDELVRRGYFIREADGFRLFSSEFQNYIHRWLRMEASKRIEAELLGKGRVTSLSLIGLPENLQMTLIQSFYDEHSEMALDLDKRTFALSVQRDRQFQTVNGVFNRFGELAKSHKGGALAPRIREVAEILGSVFSLKTASIYAGSMQHRHIHLVTFDATLAFESTNLPSDLTVLVLERETIDQPDLDHIRHYLIDHLGPSNRLALLLLFGEAVDIHRAQRLLDERLRQVYAYDTIALGREDLLRFVIAKDPQKELRRLILSKIDLTTASPFIVTGPAPSNVFVGRELELREISEHAFYTSYALIGGRRIGKSSLLIRLHRVRLPAAGFRTLYHDCSTTPTHDAFLTTAIRDWRPEPPADAPATFGELLKSPPDDKPLVLLLDEADKLVPADHANSWWLFNTLRALVNSGRAQVILSGERTLRDALRDSKSPLFNFANEMLLGPLDYPAVEELISRPMKQLEIKLVDEKAIVDRIWAFTSGHPNVVQRLCHRLIERLNEQGTRRITLDDVKAIIEDPGFQRDDFLSTYWEAATPLEKVISLLMADNENVRTLRAVRQTMMVKYCDLHPKAREVDDALQRLVDLRSILKRTPTGYEFAVEAFPRVVAGTMTLDDMLEILTEEYQEQGE